MKTKIQIKSVFGALLFEYECEDNTMAKTVTRAVESFADLRFADLRSTNLRSTNLRSTNLRFADLRFADLSFANLRFADLRFADLSFANLSFANLSFADLSFANLSFAITDKRYIQISCIGSAKRMTTYCFEDDEITCGCFKGTLEEFEKKCKETYKDNEQYLKEYMGAVEYIKSLK